MPATTYLGLTKSPGGVIGSWGADQDANLDAIDAAASKVATTQQAADYTAVAADAGTCVEMTKATACAFTVPPNASVPFPIGTVILVTQYGAGAATIMGGAGVTVHGIGTPVVTRAQYSTAALRKRATDEWIVAGDVRAWAPLTDLTSLAAWYDLGDIASMWKDAARTDPITANGDGIKGVTDKSGGGRHLSAVTSPPIYTTSAIGGRAAALWNGSANPLVAVALGPAFSAVSVFMVLTRQNDTTFRGVIDLTGSTNSRVSIVSTDDTGNKLSAYIGTGSGIYTEEWATPGVGPLLIDLLVSNTGAVSELYGGGSLRSSASGTPSIADNAQAYTIGSRAGAANLHNGYVGEVVVCTALQSSNQRAAADVFFTGKWGL